MEEKKYLKWYNKVGYGSGDIAGNVVFAFLSSFIMIYLTNTVGLNAGVIGSLIAASKVLDGISDQAILDLLDKFGEKNKEIGRVYQKYGNKEWCILSKNLKCNRGRMEIKRIIGVMANKELRKKYFGF